jgi:hypothetical protein
VREYRSNRQSIWTINGLLGQWPLHGVFQSPPVRDADFPFAKAARQIANRSAWKTTRFAKESLNPLEVALSCKLIIRLSRHAAVLREIPCPAFGQPIAILLAVRFRRVFQ